MKGELAEKNDLSSVPCSVLRGAGPSSLKKLEKLGVSSVQDLLFHLPFRYQDKTRLQSISSLKPGASMLVEGEVVEAKKPVSGKTRLFLRVCDKSGFVGLRFFYMGYAQSRSLTPGVKVRCFGEARFGPSGLEIVHPEYTVLKPGEVLPLEDCLTPVYPVTDGLHQASLRRLTDQALAYLKADTVLDELLPSSVIPKLDRGIRSSLKDALCYVHRPPPDVSQSQLLKGEHSCQRRLAFEELVAHRLSLLRLKSQMKTEAAYVLPKSTVLSKNFLASLPFQLTGAQERVVCDVSQDLQQNVPMVRLIQGDVGSGKTVVAAMAVLQAIEQGFQAAVMAPTEILAKQHHGNFSAWLEPLGIPVFFLASKLPAKQKRDILVGIAKKQASVVIGTHALFQDDVEFHCLALLVIDEQHRFGVHQRLRLREKGMDQGKHPHQLIMTATPIPRTLAMTAYADLDHSVIDELPKGRQSVTTLLLGSGRRDEIVQRVQNGCEEGRQVYWVCTLIEESEVLQCQAAEEAEKQLQEALPKLTVGLVHGRMKSVDKENVMQQFKQGEIHVLVATTVIEVGVDVPNASIMVIENPERLGLAQLHQLRGRVGRGSVKSYCVLMYQSPLSHQAKERLAILRDSNDGFVVAEKDLELRGPGEILGTQQTGIAQLRIADVMRDQSLLPQVKDTAELIARDYPEHINPLIQRWLPDKMLFGQV